MTPSRFWSAAEVACKSVRSAYAGLGALTDAVFASKLSAASARSADRPAGVSVEKQAPPVGHPSTAATHQAAATDPAGASSPLAPAGSPDWNDYAAPLICDVLTDHRALPWQQSVMSRGVQCRRYDGSLCADLNDNLEWREHVSALIADRLASDPRTAVKALAALYINQF